MKNTYCILMFTAGCLLTAVSIRAQPRLTPGAGWTDTTATPTAVGDPADFGYDAVCMAQWNVVPQRTVTGELSIGVVAFHIGNHSDTLGDDHIDRVEFAVEGGAWAAVTEPTENSRTKTNEYWVTIDAADYKDTLIEVRAVAYPKTGIPRVITLQLLADAGGTLGLTVLELGAGEHTLSSRTLPLVGYYTIQPAPGVTREECIITSASRFEHTNGGNLCLRNLTIRSSGTSAPIRGKNGWLWMDSVVATGTVKQAGDAVQPTVEAAALWGTEYWTESSIKYFQLGFAGTRLVRNCTADTLFEDAARSWGLYANVTVTHVDNATGTYHPDVFQWYNSTPDNMIVYNFSATKVYAQGLFPGDLANCAFVNLHIDNKTDVRDNAFRALQMMSSATNVLIMNSTFVGQANLRYDKGFVADRLVFENCSFPSMPDNLPSGAAGDDNVIERVYEVSGIGHENMNVQYPTFNIQLPMFDMNGRFAYPTNSRPGIYFFFNGRDMIKIVRF